MEHDVTSINLLLLMTLKKTTLKEYKILVTVVTFKFFVICLNSEFSHSMNGLFKYKALLINYSFAMSHIRV